MTVNDTTVTPTRTVTCNTLTNSRSYLNNTQDLKSWASVKRACRFKSGPGHHKYITTLGFPLFSGCLFGSMKLVDCVNKRHFRTHTDTAVTPLRPHQDHIQNQNTEKRGRGAYGEEIYGYR